VPILHTSWNPPAAAASMTAFGGCTTAPPISNWIPGIVESQTTNVQSGLAGPNGSSPSSSRVTLRQAARSASACSRCSSADCRSSAVCGSSSAERVLHPPSRTTAPSARARGALQRTSQVPSVSLQHSLQFRPRQSPPETTPAILLCPCDERCAETLLQASSSLGRVRLPVVAKVGASRVRHRNSVPVAGYRTLVVMARRSSP
jgi:hypothetical protein